LNIHFEYEEVTIEKVVPFFKPFTTIFYLKYFKLRKIMFESNQVWNRVEFVWNLLNPFDHRLVLLPGPPVNIIPHFRLGPQAGHPVYVFLSDIFFTPAFFLLRSVWPSQKKIICSSTVNSFFIVLKIRFTLLWDKKIDLIVFKKSRFNS
jgi:hypothetical protein